MKTTAAIMIVAILFAPFAAADGIPPAGAGAGACVVAKCIGASTSTTTIVQQCGANGNVFVFIGDKNTVNMCNQNATGEGLRFR